VSGIPRVEATLDGSPIPAKWRAFAEFGGYHRCSAESDRSSLQLIDPFQGSILKLWQANGRALWEGRLARAPYYVQNVAQLEASGYKIAGEKKKDRLVYQTRDLATLVDATGPPHNLASFANPMSITTSPLNVITGQASNPTAGSKTYGAKLALWAPGASWTRYAFTFSGGASITVKHGAGPAGTLTTIATHSSPGSVDQAITNGADMLVIEISVALSTNADAAFQIKDFRANDAGTTTDIFYSSQIVADIGSRLGWDTSGVQATSLNVLPQDVNGGPWTGELDVMAVLDDWQWRVLDDRGHGPFLEYTPWEREFVVMQGAGARVRDVLPQELFNRVLVWWNDDGGGRHHVEAIASPDPLARSGQSNTYEMDVGVQPHDLLARAVADLLLPEVSRERWVATIDLAEVQNEGATPYDVLPGDVITIADAEFGTFERQRVTSCEYAPNGVVVGAGMDASAAALIGRAAIPGLPIVQTSIGGGERRSYGLGGNDTLPDLPGGWKP
jgi:hypothetical protein